MRYADISWSNNLPYSPGYDDIYYSDAGIREEAEYVFVQSNNLPGRFQGAKNFVIAETGFGFGLNFAVTLAAWHKNTVDEATLDYIGIEKHPVSPENIDRLSQTWPDLREYFDALLSCYPLPVRGKHTRVMCNGRVRLHLLFMDVQEALRDESYKVNAWYLDGFSPDKNAELWCADVFESIAQNSCANATLSTYTSAGQVRRGLIQAGFEVKKIKGYGKKREMTTACLVQEHKNKSTSPWYELPQQVTRGRSAAIVGAGLAGLTAAWSLLERGWRVTVIDRYSDIAQMASGNPAGLVAPRFSIDNPLDTEFYSCAFIYALHRLEILQSLSDDQFWFRGGTYSISNKHRTRKLKTSNDFAEEFVKFPALNEIPEILRQHDGALCLLPEAGWAMPYKICQAIIKHCSPGIELMSGTVTNLEREQDGWLLQDQSGETIKSADMVVIASGVDANRFDATSWLNINAVRGQVTGFPANEKSSDLKYAISFDGYVTPAYRGFHYTGASYVSNADNCELNADEHTENFNRLAHAVPSVFSVTDEPTGRVGFRAVSEDRVPVVGAVPDCHAFERNYSDLRHGKPVDKYCNAEYLPDLYITAAHGSRGMCSSFLSAEIIASMASSEILPVRRTVADYINPSRFIIRRLRRGR